MIREFMDSIGQQTLLKQYESAHNELENLDASRHALLGPFERLFDKLARIYRWQPFVDKTTTTQTSKHARLLEWLRRLREDATATTLRDVYTGYVHTYNRAFKLTNMGRLGASVLNSATSTRPTTLLDFSAEAKMLSLRPELETLEKCVEELTRRRDQLASDASLDQLKAKFVELESQILTFFEHSIAENETSKSTYDFVSYHSHCQVQLLLILKLENFHQKNPTRISLLAK